MRVVVTGYSGMCGAAICALLLSAGAVLLSPPEDRLPLFEDPVTGAREVDFATPEYAAWLREVRPEAIVHAGAVTSSHRSALLGARLTSRSNIAGQLNVVRTAADLGARVLLFGSDSMFDPEDFPRGLSLPGGRTPPTRYGPRTMYGVTKLAGHLAAREVLGDRLLALYPSFGWGGPRDGMTILSALVRAAAGVPGYPADLRLQLDPARRKGVTWHQDIARLSVALLSAGATGEFAAAGRPVDALPFGVIVERLRALSGAELPVTWLPELDYKGDMFYTEEEVERAWSRVGLSPEPLSVALAFELELARKVSPLRTHTWTGMETLADAAGLPAVPSPGVS